MPTTVKTGWLKDSNGDKFAPKTLTSQVQTSDGIILEDKIQADINAALSAKEFDLVAMGMPIVEVDGGEVEFVMDTFAIQQAAQNGTVRAKLNIKIGSLTYNNTVIDFSYFEVETVSRNRYLVASVPAVGTSFYCQILIGENRIIASAYTLSAGGASVPTYAGVVEVE